MALEPTDPTFERARRAYELGRLRLGSRAGLYVLPVLALSLALGGPWRTSVLLSAVLAVAVVGLVWRGEAFSRAVGPGLSVGVAASLVPVAVRCGHGCALHGCESACFVACVLAGALAGLWLGLRARAEIGGGRWGYLFGAALTAGITSSVGCATIGLSGMIGIAGAVLVSSVSAVFVAAPLSR